MSDKTVSVGLKIEGDAKGARDAIEATEKELQKLPGATKEAKGSAEALNASFARLGIRSAAQIEADILAVNQALADLARRANVSGTELDRAWAAGQAQIAKLKGELADLPLGQTTGGIGSLTGAFSSLQGVLGALGLSGVTHQFLDANLAADKLQKSLNAVNGDSRQTADDLAFLKETAQRLGINLASSSAGFVKLAAAAKGTSLEGQATRDIFTGVGGALSQLGLSSAETERAFVALGQMMSKGVVSAEELKGQLGDVLPGTMAIAARATGLTTQELSKLMETGGLLAEDFLPKFAAEAQRSFGGAGGEVQGMSNSIERLKNTWAETFAAIGEAGGLKVLGVVVAALNAALMVCVTTVGLVLNGLVGLAEAAGVTAAALANMDFSDFSASVSEIGERVGRSNEKLVEMSNRALGLGDSMGRTGEALNKTGVAARGAASAAEAAGAGWERLVVAYDLVAKSAADYVDLTKKTTKANDDQADVLVKLAQLSSDENALLRAKEDAARVAAEGSARLAHALEIEAKTLQAKVAALQEEVAGQKLVSDEKIKAIEEARKAAAAKMEEARAALGGADAARVAAAASEAETQARADNSLRVNELRDAYAQATLKVDVLKAAQVSGIDVSGELTIAQTAAAKAAHLYKDALADQTANIGVNLAAKQSQIGIEQAGIRLAIEQQRTIYEVARARGDEYGATQALLEIKKLEIKLAELTAQAKRAEADAALLTAQANREVLRVTGQLTAAKEAELKAQEAGAKVKQVEAQIAGETAKRMRELADAYGRAGASAAGASGHIGGIGAAAQGSVPGVDALTSSLTRLNAAQAGGGIKGADGITRNEAGQHVDPQSGRVLTDKNGNPITNSTSLLDMGHQTDKQVDIATEMYKRGASIEEVKAAQKYYGELYDRNAATMLTGNLGNGQNAARQQNIAMTDAMDKAIKFARQELATGQAVDLGTSVRDFEARNLATTKTRAVGDQAAAIKRAGNEASNQTRTIRLELGSGGRKSSVYADSEADAAAFIKTIEAAGMRTRR